MTWPVAHTRARARTQESGLFHFLLFFQTGLLVWAPTTTTTKLGEKGIAWTRRLTGPWTNDISRNPTQEVWFRQAVYATGLVIGTRLRQKSWMPTEEHAEVTAMFVLCTIFINRFIIKCCVTNFTNKISSKQHLPRTCTPLSVPHKASQLQCCAFLFKLES